MAISQKDPFIIFLFLAISTPLIATANETSSFNLSKVHSTIANLVSKESPLVLHIYGKFSDNLRSKMFLLNHRTLLYSNVIENWYPTSENCTFFLEKLINLSNPIKNVFSEFKPKFSNSMILIISVDWLGNNPKVIENMTLGISRAAELLTFKAIIFISETEEVENLLALNSNLVVWDYFSLDSKVIIVGKNGIPKMMCGSCNLELKKGDQPVLMSRYILLIVLGFMSSFDS